MNTSPFASPATSPVSERAVELCQQHNAFATLLNDTSIGLDAIHVRTLQEWLEESERELAQRATETVK